MPKYITHYGLEVASDIITVVRAISDKSGKITEVFCKSCPSAGISDGAIKELGLLSETISRLLGGLSASCGQRIKSLTVSMPSLRLKVKHSSGLLPISERSNKIITSSDMDKVIRQAYNLGLGIDEYVLCSIPQGYTVDNQAQLINPLGLYSHRLGVELLLVTALYPEAQNLVSAVEKAGYKVQAVILSSLAASLSALPEEDKARGCCFLDMGYDFIRMLAFKDGILKGMECFDFGSKDLNRALSQELKIPYELAGQIKASYGAAFAQGKDLEQEVLVSQKDKTYRPIKRRLISSVLENKLRDMFTLIKERFSSRYRIEDFPAGVIVCGRDALLDGFLESLEESLGLAVSLAKMEDLPVKDISCAGAIGLIKHSLSQYPKIEFFKLSGGRNIVEKIARKSKEIYQEYF